MSMHVQTCPLSTYNIVSFDNRLCALEGWRHQGIFCHGLLVAVGQVVLPHNSLTLLWKQPAFWKLGLPQKHMVQAQETRHRREIHAVRKLMKDVGKPAKRRGNPVRRGRWHQRGTQRQRRSQHQVRTQHQGTARPQGPTPEWVPSSPEWVREVHSHTVSRVLLAHEIDFQKADPKNHHGPERHLQDLLRHNYVQKEKMNLLAWWGNCL